MESVKFDTGKPRFDLLPVQPIEEIAEALTYGATKYADRNYLGLAWGRVFAALMRHSWAWWRGEECDEESGLPHLAHAGACIVMLREAQIFKRGNDDRFRG